MIKNIVLYGLTYLLFISGAQAQNSYIDSLDAVIHSDIDDTLKFYAYTQVIWANQSRKSDYALQLNEGFINMAKDFNKPAWINQAKYYYCVIHKHRGEYHTAIDYAEEVVGYYEKNKDTAGVANISYQKGVIQKNMSNYEKAVETFNKTIELYHLVNDKRMVATTLDAKGSLYRSLKLYDRAIESYKQAIKINQDIKDSLGLSRNYNNIGNAYSEIDSLDKALECQEIQIRINDLIQNVWGNGFAFENKGRILTMLGQYEEAIQNLKKSESIRREFQNNNVLIPVLLQIGRYLY